MNALIKSSPKHYKLRQSEGGEKAVRGKLPWMVLGI